MTTKADTAAAERLLKAAVKRAVVLLREPKRMDGMKPLLNHFGVKGTPYRPRGARDVEAMLRAAGESAELLIGADR